MSRGVDSAERAELQGVVRDMLASSWSRDSLRAGLDGQPLEAELAWKRFAEEVGLAGLLVPSVLGGADGELEDAVTALEEVGRSLAPLPFLSSSVVAASMLLGIPSQSQLVEDIASGARVMAVGGIWGDDVAPVLAEDSGDSVRVSGEIFPVLDAGMSTDLIVAAQHGGRLCLVLVGSRSEGVTVEASAAFDASLSLSTVRLDNAVGRVLSFEAEQAVRSARTLARIGLAATLVGTMRAAFEATVTQVKGRTQFGRIVGGYQAIKHRLADLAVDVETSASALDRAVRAVRAEEPEREAFADLALTWIADKARRVVLEMIQLHGGMGYTWEHDAHLFYRRVFAASSLLGAGDRARDRSWAAVVRGLGGDADTSVEVAGSRVAAEVAEFIDDNWSEDLTVRQWWRRMADAGLTLPSLPEELGGRGWSSADEGQLAEAMSAAGVTLGPGGIGRALAAPTIAAAGTAEQKARFLPGILDGTEAWCQLFSEPEAGSDLAGLRTRAVRDGDGWRITGQKTWTSNGHVADYAILLARTDVDVPKHQGITYFLFPMRQDGVEIRPIREMNGHAMFNDVFIDGAWVPDTNRLGELGEGWKWANLTLSVERSSIAAAPAMTPAMPGEIAQHLDRPAREFVESFDPHSLGVVTDETVARLIRVAEAQGASDVAVRRGLVDLAFMSQVRVEGMLRDRDDSRRSVVGPNVAKIHSNTALHRARDLIAVVMGPRVGAELRTADESWARELFMYAPAPSIYGGTDEIQRNIIAERGLGLPREMDPSRAVAFRDISSVVR